MKNMVVSVAKPMTIFLAFTTIGRQSLCMDQAGCTIEDAFCSVCKNYLHKIFPKTAFCQPATSLISVPITGCCIPMTMVVVKTNDDMWECGLHLNCTQEGNGITYNVHMCNSHLVKAFTQEQVRDLKMIFQVTYQPFLPNATLKNTLDEYMAAYERTSVDPFFLGHIIKTSDSVTTIGDLHGSEKSLRLLLQKLVLKNVFDHQCKLKEGQICVFTGDYADRGRRGAQVWQILMRLKLLNPQQIFFLRGNHETTSMANHFSFLQEWANTYKLHASREQQVTSLQSLFNTLASGLVLGIQVPPTVEKPYGSYRFLLFVHGGLDSSAPVYRTILNTIASHQLGSSEIVCQQYTVSDFDHSDILWSDFVANKTSDQDPTSCESSRGPGMRTFNTSAFYEFMENHVSNHPKHTFSLDALFRGHQHIPGGIHRLREVIHHESSFEPLPTKIPIKIDHPMVFNCISSPEGLGQFGCLEDSYATITWTEDHWQVIPRIYRRVPKKFANMTLTPEEKSGNKNFVL